MGTYVNATRAIGRGRAAPVPPAKRPLRRKEKAVIGLLLSANSMLDRSIMRGVIRFARANCAWTFRHQTSTSPALPFDDVQTWGGDGAIGDIDEPYLLDRLEKLGIPFVDVTNTMGAIPMQRILFDHKAIGAVVTSHFIERRIPCLAYYGGRYGWSEERYKAFMHSAEASGRQCIRAPFKEWATDGRHLRGLARWLATLPRPAGIMACSDLWALHILNACELAGLAVPDDIAVVGVDDDDLLCTFANPTLTSVRLPGERLGAEAARLLQAMMDGAPIPTTPILIPPVGIVARESTDVFRATNPTLSAALRYLREHSGTPISVHDLAHHVRTSPRTLERQFVAELGRTPLDEINRVRIERARTLLGETRLSIAAIANAAGFGTVKHLHRLFRSTTGVTPGAYRHQFSHA